jgi:hypothetical protein
MGEYAGVGGEALAGNDPGYRGRGGAKGRQGRREGLERYREVYRMGSGDRGLRYSNVKKVTVVMLAWL